MAAKASAATAGVRGRPAVVAVVAFYALLFPVTAVLAHGRPAEPTMTVSAATFASTWPLTVLGGVLRCEPAGEITFRARGRTYSLNPPARYAETSFDVAPLRTGDLGPLIALGTTLCR